MSHPARTILVAGPPCSGKTTYVEQHRGPGDLVLDLDTIARDLGSPVQWLHPQPYSDQAEQAMRAQMAQLPGAGPHTAWVIRTASTPKARAFITRLIRASTCLVINPGITSCISRARTDNRPARTIDLIHDWYATYRPWSGDTNPDPEPKPWNP